MFGRPAVIRLNGRPQEARVADLNGDGISDLAVSTYSSIFWVYRGKRDGTFPDPACWSFQIGNHTRSWFMREWYISRVGVVGNELLIFPSLGNGSFGPPVPTRTGYPPSDIGTADFNLDHKPDVAVSSEGALWVSIFLQTRQRRRIISLIRFAGRSDNR
jgi:hypothetical protein